MFSGSIFDLIFDCNKIFIAFGKVFIALDRRCIVHILLDPSTMFSLVSAPEEGVTDYHPYFSIKIYFVTHH